MLFRSAEQRAAQQSADADLVADRSGRFIHDFVSVLFAVPAGQHFMIPPGWVSRHRAILVIGNGRAVPAEPRRAMDW